MLSTGPSMLPTDSVRVDLDDVADGRLLLALLGAVTYGDGFPSFLF